MTKHHIQVPQGDDAIIQIGPLEDANGNLYDATGAVASFRVKKSQETADTDAMGVADGILEGDTTVGFIATFAVPRTLNATPGWFWHHAFVTDTDDNIKTISHGLYEVQPT